MTESEQALHTVQPDYVEYLRDESRMTGQAESISFPRSETDLIAHIREAVARGQTITVQGARTGITGASVPRGGHILNLSRMNRVLGMNGPDRSGFTLTVQPGLLLTDLRGLIASRTFDTSGWSAESQSAAAAFQDAGPFFFPPDPTETSATLGGMAACNASGALTYAYGATRRYVERLRVVRADGDVLDLSRGRERAGGRAFVLVTEGGRRIEGMLPGYAMPAVKNAAGYYAAPDMDLLDLFIGSEGTLGVLSEVTIRVVPAPSVVWGLMAFLPSDGDAVRFTRRVRESGIAPAALELFNDRALDLLRDRKRTHAAFEKIPELKPVWHSGVYVELHAASEAEAEERAMAVSEIMIECGGTEDGSWLASDAREMARLKDLRHAVPEAVNLTIDERRRQEPKLTKLGTDLAVPDRHLESVMDMYVEGLRKADLEYVIFGHIGNNHVHVNILPRSLAEYEEGKTLYLEWARRVIAMGGTVAAEHGIGKLKVALLREMFGEDGVRQMRDVKRAFDSAGVLSPGNLFAAE